MVKNQLHKCIIYRLEENIMKYDVVYIVTNEDEFADVFETLEEAE